MIYLYWPPGPFLAAQYDKQPGGAGFEATGILCVSDFSWVVVVQEDGERHLWRHQFVTL